MINKENSGWIGKHTNIDDVMMNGIWKSLPQHLQRVIVKYSNNEISDMVWWSGKVFRNKYGIQLYNIIDWKPYLDTDGNIEFHEEKSKTNE